MNGNISESEGRFQSPVSPLLRRGWILIALQVLGGCAVYHPRPMAPKSVDVALSPPDMNELRVEAGAFVHPLLQPVPFDERNGLSPDEAAILAVIVNPRLRALRDRRGIAAAQLLQAGILPNPRLAYGFGVPVGANRQSGVNTYDLGLDWDIASLISRSARRDAAEAHASSVDLDIAWQEWQVAQGARLWACHLIMSRERLATAQRMEASCGQLLEAVAKGVALGVKTRFDLSAARTGLQEARSRELDARAGVDQARLAFNRALGLPAEHRIPLEQGSAARLKPCPPVKTLLEHAETGRLDLLALKRGYESQEAKLRGAVRSQFPRISLGLTGGRDTDNVRTIGAGLSIDLPFFDHDQGPIAQARATRKQLFDEYSARVFETRADIDGLVAALRAAGRRLSVMDESLATQTACVEDLRRAAQVGQAEVFAVYQAQNLLYSRQIQSQELEQRMIDLGLALEIACARYGLIVDTGSRPQAPAQGTQREMPK